MANTTDMKVNIGGLQLKNPIIAASGTYGYGLEYSEYVKLDLLGAISVKAVSLELRHGNPPPRVAETPSGMLNSVGLQNSGVKYFIKYGIPFLRKYDTKIIVNIAGNSADEYKELAQILDGTDIDAFEVNVSCPNVKHGGASFGVSCDSVSEITGLVRKSTKKPIIVKLTPNVTDITEIAKAAEASGADSVSLINTLLGMVIDIDTRKPVLNNNYGGLSGPAVRPVAVRMVNQVFNAVKIPVIGMGGIMDARDSIEFMLAGASAVMVGTANFITPTACVDIANELEVYCNNEGLKTVAELTGAVKLY
ncbi:MAG: dihydroorotate dehydrogenase [Bacillota bacterium]